MKYLKTMLASLVCASTLSAAPGDVYEGVVIDTLNGGGYTYLELEAFGKKFWAAVEGIKIEKGTEVRFTEELKAKNFESLSLKRTFDEIIFASNLQYRTKVAETGKIAVINELVKESPYKQKDTLSVKESTMQRKELNGKTIVVRGKVVKASENILERNFIHIQDGTGEGSEVGRIVFTSKELPKVGDVVSAKGVVSVDKNFGSGYVYAIIVENASFTK